MRSNGGILWTQDPFRVLREYGPAEFTVQYPGIAMTTPYWIGRADGVIEEGAYADLLLINGNPLADISILTKPEENLALIMKDGKIFKNTVE